MLLLLSRHVIGGAEGVHHGAEILQVRRRQVEQAFCQDGAPRRDPILAPGLYDGRDLMSPAQSFSGDELSRLSGGADDCDFHKNTS